jgi:hypothetical protein
VLPSPLFDQPPGRRRKPTDQNRSVVYPDDSLVTDTFIRLGPRAEDASFDPQPGDVLLAGDDDEPPVPAAVVRRDHDRVWIRLDPDVRV